MKHPLIILFLFFSLSTKANEIVVLVPGFFNTFTPEYFSKDVVHSFTRKGLKVYVAKDLNPIGSILENGTRLEKFLQSVQTVEGHPVEFNIVAHSAGGFYSLWVADRKNIHIKSLFTVSTPFKGIEFIQTWLEKSFLFSNLADLAYLEGLRELTPGGVQKFLKTIHLNSKMQINIFGGYQNESLDITDARNISAPLLVTSHFISGKSDGIVSMNSALGLNPVTKTPPGDLIIHLEHWEQVLEPTAFVFLGIRNTEYIQQEQARFYTKLADLILQTKNPL